MIELEKLVGWSKSNKLAGLKKRYARPEKHGLAEIVCDEDDGLAEAPGEGAEFALKFGARDGIKSAERLVHEKNRRIGSQGAGDADALALASGKLPGKARRELGRIEADQKQEFLDAGADSRGIPFFEARDEGDVLCNGKVRKEPAFLNNVSNAAAKTNGVGVGGGAAFDEDLAGGRKQHSIDETEQGSLAAPAAAEEDQSFAPRDQKRNTFDNDTLRNIVYVKAHIAKLDGKGARRRDFRIHFG